MSRYVLGIWMICALGAGPAIAQFAASDKSVEVKEPWARATAGAAATGAAYVTLTNTGTANDRLVSASTPVAGKAELHTMTMEGDVMRMRQVHGIDVNPGASVELKPGGLHIMLMELKSPLKEGEKFPLILTFEKAGSETVDVEIKSIGATGPSAPMHH